VEEFEETVCFLEHFLAGRVREARIEVFHDFFAVFAGHGGDTELYSLFDRLRC
jgi:hypothetical protein